MEGRPVSSAYNEENVENKRRDLVFPPRLINLIYETREEISLTNEIPMTLKSGTVLPRYGYCLNLIFINVDNSLYGPYGDITSTLKFNYIFRASVNVFCRIRQSGASAARFMHFGFIIIWN